MSQRLHDTTKWMWCLLIVYSGSIWNPVKGVTVRSPPNNPSTIQAQAKFFQYRHFPSSEDYDQGHRLGSDRHFTERHERSRPATGLFSAKVRWGDKKGGYGEHYWDLNHAGHAGDHGNDHANYDDGSYHEPGDTYDEPSEQSPNYDTNNYETDSTEQHEDNSREKRTPKRIRVERGQIVESNEEDKPQVRCRPARKQKEQKEAVNEDSEEQANSNQEVYRKPSKIQQRRPQNQDNEQEEEDSHEVYRKPIKPEQRHPQKQQYNIEEIKSPRENNQLVLVVDEKEKEEKPPQYVQRQHEPQVFVPYEGGAGVRQHYAAEITPAASVPRLFLEPATGHVVDRATGQAYVLQPIIRNPNYS